jgi:hypothetical protein
VQADPANCKTMPMNICPGGAPVLSRRAAAVGQSRRPLVASRPRRGHRKGPAAYRDTPPPSSSRRVTCPGRFAGRRRRNSTERSPLHRQSRKNYFPPSPAARRRLTRRDPPYHGTISMRPVRHHLRRNNLTMNYQGFGTTADPESDKTRIFPISRFCLRGRSTVNHREQHSGHPWRWIECSAGIGPHGAVEVGTVARLA